MSSNFQLDELDSNFKSDDENYWNAPSSTIFLVDATEEMQENGYLPLCFESFKNIVRQKCSDNRRDKVGLIIYGTQNTNCNIDNVMVLQEYNTVSIDTLQTIKDILKNGTSKYKPLTSGSNYSLYAVLSYVLQIFNSTSKTSVKESKTILLCTCHNKPRFDDPSERQRIEHLVATFKDLYTKLLVVGLSSSWNDNVYYRDLQIISGTCTDDNYKKIDLKELEGIILRPAKSLINLQWKISQNIHVPVVIQNIISTTPKYPSKIKLYKHNNELLESNRIFVEHTIEDFCESPSDPERKPKAIPQENIKFYKTYCGLNVTFTATECKQLKHLYSEAGIEILAFKPVVCDPMYHLKSPYFVTCAKTCSYETTSFFMAFVSRCAKKKVMPVCKVITNSVVLFGTMIPSEDDGGFYFYKMPVQGGVRDLSYRFEDYIFNSKNKCPFNETAARIFKQLFELSRVEFDPKLFKNPKLEKISSHLEALAFDEELKSLPPDTTLPPPIKGGTENLTKALKSLLSLKDEKEKKRPSSQKGANEKRQKLDIKDMVKSKTLHLLTMPDLKEILKAENLSTNGTKTHLLNRIYNYFER